ncbi:insulinase family protein [Celerinatantimonas yamalensis]|uniref:Protease 3 n=1 Tax=Celerinatantimonas yamalensis TaxID=559956 RepID=A0ABW9G1V3_9GAMM
MRTSPNDSRNYQLITLDNGLRALLISDPQVQKSAASLAVNVGHFDDPQDRQGLAHFLEHMLFLGTDKYPHAGEYQQFINHHGGSNNAWTGTEYTNYFFDIDSPWFEAALDRFSQFFISPRFIPELVDKERQAVHSEYHLKIQDDVRRLYQVHKETVNPDHPFSKFSVGSLDTLADRPDASVRDDLISFYQQQYSADRMTLVLMSHHSLEELNQWLSYFTEITRRSWPVRQLPQLLREQDQGLFISIQPVKEVRQLTLSFTFQESVRQLYHNKPLEYLAHIIGYEGQGSLIAKLRQTGLIQTMAAGGGISGADFREFTLSYQLNEAGLNEIDAIIEATFDYLRLIALNGIEMWRYREKQQVLEHALHFQERLRAIDLVSHLAINLHYFAPEDVLVGDYLMTQFDRVEICHFLEQMTPQRMRVTLVAPDLKTTRCANWYHTPYHVQALSNEQLARWQAPHAHQLTLPPENPFINSPPSQLILNDITDKPQLLIDIEGFRLWHQQDGEFPLPKGHIYLSVDSAVAVQSVHHIACSRLAVELILDHLNEVTYQAEIAGMGYQFYAHQGGFTIHTAGFNARQFDLLKMILNGRLFGQYNPQRFDVIKKQLQRNWQNQRQIKPINQLFHQLTALLQPNNPTGPQLAAALASIQLEQMPEFIANLYQKVHIETLVYGSWSKLQAIEISEYIQRELAPQSRPADETPRQLVSISGMQTLVYEHPCPSHSDSALLMYFQSAQANSKQIALFTFCNHLMSSTFFYELRTKQQLGYIVGNGNLPLNRHPGLLFYIQSPHASPTQMREAIDEFIDNFPLLIHELSGQEWGDAKSGLASQILERESNMRTRARRYWVSIGNKDEDFDQRQKVVDELMSLTRAELMRFTIGLKSPHRDRMILYTTGAKQEQSCIQGDRIESIEHFHASAQRFVY